MTAYKFRKLLSWIWLLALPMSLLFLVIGWLADLEVITTIGVVIAAIFLAAFAIHSFMWVQVIGEFSDVRDQQ